jgi:hypothetical protein
MAVKQANYDFSGWATKHNIKCSDGRTIRQDAFKDCDGMTVPLVWQHLHGEPENILGHAYLENRPEGVYAYGKFNETSAGKNGKLLVQHGDITFLSIYANQLQQESANVMHGTIREVSLVVAGANPGARIDNMSFTHSDGSEFESDTQVEITSGESILLPTPEEPKKIEEEPVATIKHADPAPAADAEETVGDVFDTLTDKQKQVVYALIAEVADAAAADNGAVAQSDDDENGESMKHNVFDKEDGTPARNTLTHAQFDAIMSDAKRGGSLKESILAHAGEDTYGITDIDFMFPDAQTVSNSPAMIGRRMEWVTNVINSTNHVPFANVKSLAADITAETARARGYVKGTMKKNELIALLKRVTTPKTIYKKQKLDRDDVLDITDFDVVAWMKMEMRLMLDEEVARAILVGDGRDPSSEDKIDEAHLRPIWTDDEVYAHHIRLDEDAEVDEVIDAVVKGRENYMGSGSPTLYAAPGFVSDMLLTKDTLGRRLYVTQQELEAVLRVSKIVEVPIMAGLTRESADTPAVNLELLGIVVNLKDYTIGANKGGEVSMFDNFDIDFNQLRYLIETRISGALTLPKSALVIEKVGAAG